MRLARRFVVRVRTEPVGDGAALIAKRDGGDGEPAVLPGRPAEAALGTERPAGAEGAVPILPVPGRVIGVDDGHAGIAEPGGVATAGVLQRSLVGEGRGAVGARHPDVNGDVVDE
jgi:hypothetical protein